MKILRPRTYETNTHYCVSFEWPDQPGCGFSFDSDENGVVDEGSLNPVAQANYKACLTGIVEGKPIGPARLDGRENVYTEPAVGECEVCKREVELFGFTNTCECGADYNSAGQRLAPREFWGEETGETAADILRGGDPWE